jgi:predicted MFS family arabinose efflux permease
VTRTLTVLFAVTSGLSVANLYYAQPILDLICRDLQANQGLAGLLVTVTQLGYATGIILIVPLGDRLDRRRLIPTLMAICAVALIAAGVAPTFSVLLAALGAVGLTTVSTQIILPLAGELAAVESRGRVVGIVASGALTGVLAARTLSGLIAGIAGWRTIYFVSAALTLLAAFIFRAKTPISPGKSRTVSYFGLLRTVLRLALHERQLQLLTLSGAITYGTFTLFWTSLTFLLSAKPYEYSPTRIGLFGLAGLLGTVAAQGAGRLHDRGWSIVATKLTWLFSGLTWLLFAMSQRSVVELIVVIVLFDIGVQSRNILTQALVFSVQADAGSRLNTVYRTGNFIGGAVGSAVSSVLWLHGGWAAVVMGGGSMTVLGALMWILMSHSCYPKLRRD